MVICDPANGHNISNKFQLYFSNNDKFGKLWNAPVLIKHYVRETLQKVHIDKNYNNS